MVGLHVLDNHIIQLAAAQSVRQIFKKYLADCLIHRIKKDGRIIGEQIGIIGYACRNRVDPFKHSQPAVVPADPYQIIGQLFCAVHRIPPFSNTICLVL